MGESGVCLSVHTLSCSVASTETEHKVKGGFLLDVVVAESPAVLELLSGEDEPLLIGRDALLVLDLGLDILNGVAGLDVKSDGLSGECFHKDLHVMFASFLMIIFLSDGVPHLNKFLSILIILQSQSDFVRNFG